MLNLPGVNFKELEFRPKGSPYYNRVPKYNGMSCSGIEISISDKNLVIPEYKIDLLNKNKKIIDWSKRNKLVSEKTFNILYHQLQAYLIENINFEFKKNT